MSFSIDNIMLRIQRQCEVNTIFHHLYAWSVFAILVTAGTGCKLNDLDVPPHPYREEAEVTREADEISQKLDRYIRDWFAGKAGSAIPPELIPNGIKTKGYNDVYRLVRYQDIDPNKQYAIRKAQPIDMSNVHHSFPDPNCTYITDLKMILPFGHKMVIEGEFPHCRFFSIQATPPFDTDVYHYGYAGEGEVPLVDVDITPKSGHVNPFRVGANRNAKKRSYRVEFTAKKGSTWDLNKASRPPYRQRSNHRYITGITYLGPWGDPGWVRNYKSLGAGDGMYETGELWIRYYRPDKGTGWKAGVPLPKTWYELPDGRRYFIQKDVEYAMSTHLNTTYKAPWALPQDPKPYHDAEQGWTKQFGIMLAGLEAISRIHDSGDKETVRKLYHGITGRGADLPKNQGTEAHKTAVPHINYLLRGMSLGWGKVAVLTGKLPTFPDTYKGSDRMSSAQMRYWSLTGYDNSKILEGIAGGAVQSIRDDELILDKERRYIIVLSRKHSRPSNATAENGCTWRDWGPGAEYSWTLRWMSIEPNWAFGLSPDEHLLKWSETSWSGSNYDPGLIGENDHDGILKEYLPRVHYMSRSEFEALGKNFSVEDIPGWEK